MTAEAVPIAFVRACKKCISKQDCPSIISQSKAKEVRFFWLRNVCCFCLSLSSCLFLFLRIFGGRQGFCVCFYICLERTDLSLVCFQVFLLTDADLRACPSAKVDSYMLFTKKDTSSNGASGSAKKDTSSNGASGSASEPKQMSVRNNEFFILYSMFSCSAPSFFSVP